MRAKATADPLQVAVPKAVEGRMELEFYPVGKLGGQPPAALIERIKTELRGAAWDEERGGGAIYFDPPSKCLIVLQSRAVQVQIESLLAK